VEWNEADPGPVRLEISAGVLVFPRVAKGTWRMEIPGPGICLHYFPCFGIEYIIRLSMAYKILLLLHLLCATIWVGGHLLLVVRYLPEALRKKDAAVIRQFETHFEPLGMPALLIQILTGIYIAYFHHDLPFMSFSKTAAAMVNTKIILLLATIALAIHARFFIIPKLHAGNLVTMAWHIVGVTAIAILMLTLGFLFRFGGL
jgi:putative copper export protein